MIGEVIAWVITFAICTGIFFVFYYYLLPWLQEEYPDNKYRVVGISTAVWTGIFIILVWGVRPLF